MELSLSTPALLFPAIAILMLGYINRYLGTASVIRTFKKDYDSGYSHTNVTAQLRVLAKRIELSRIMLTVGVLALLFACISMLLIFVDQPEAGAAAFSISIGSMIFSLFISLYETKLSNKSLNIEINDLLSREEKKKNEP